MADRSSTPGRGGAFGAALQASLEAEIFEERAASLGRAGRRLETAIGRLQAFDAGQPLPPLAGHVAPDRAALLADAREALWFLVVQREACGMAGSEDVLVAYGVPKEVSSGVTTERVVWRRRR
ncbi:MAG: DUF6665 family protein [Bauldia sp.]